MWELKIVLKNFNYQGGWQRIVLVKAIRHSAAH